MITFATLASLYFIFHGAIHGRIDGGGVAKVSEWVERTLVMSGFVIACAPFAGLWALAAYPGVVGIATGHGQYFLAMTAKAIAPEFFDFIVSWLFGKDPRTSDEYKKWRGDKWSSAPQEIKDKLHLEMQAYGHGRLYRRCVFGMFVTGTLVGLPAALVAFLFGNLYGGFFLLTGVVKSLAYIIGWEVFKDTAPAEYINGGGRNALCLIVIIFALSTIMN
jgi:hypothetical protein